MTFQSFSKTTALAAFLAVPLLVNAQSAVAECESQIDRALREKAIAQEDILSIKTARRPGGSKAADIHRVDAWIKLKSCGQGHLMINMTRKCVVQQYYTTGGCEISGMPSY